MTGVDDGRIEFLTHERRVQNVHLGWKIYQDFLTEEERIAVGKFEEVFPAGGTVGIWMQAKRVSRWRAIIEVARCLGLPEAEYERLLNRLGEQRSAIPKGRQTPVWVKESSTLLLDGEIIKQIRRPNQARNQIRILDAFQEEGWPGRIDDPLPRPATGVDSRQLGEAVRRLKQGLQRITFGRDGSGEGVRWEFAPGDPTAK
jgi:hypothetical protein